MTDTKLRRPRPARQILVERLRAKRAGTRAMVTPPPLTGAQKKEAMEWVGRQYPALEKEVLRRVAQMFATQRTRFIGEMTSSSGRSRILAEAAGGAVAYLGGRTLSTDQMPIATADVIRKIDARIGILKIIATVAGSIFTAAGLTEADELGEAMEVLDQEDPMSAPDAWRTIMEGLRRAREKARHTRPTTPPPPGYPGDRPTVPAPPPAREAEGESGWDIARRKLTSSAAARPAAVRGSAPRPIVPAGPAAKANAPASLPASEARKQLARAVAPAFAAAIDKAVNADLVVRFVRRHPQGGDLARVRHGYVVSAARQFATEFVRTISAAPKGTSENLALGAIIATALAQAGRQFPLVPAAATPAMSVLIHKQLGPRLPALAALAARIARSVPTAAPLAAPSREMAW